MCGVWLLTICINYVRADRLQLVLLLVRARLPALARQRAGGGAEQQRSEGWESLVNPVESAPPSEPLWNSSFQAS